MKKILACFLLLAIFFSFSIGAYAANLDQEGYVPPIKQLWGEQINLYPYALVTKDSDRFKLYLFAGKPFDTGLYVTTNPVSQSFQYREYSAHIRDTEWSHSYDGTNTINIDRDFLWWTSTDIYNGSTVTFHYEPGVFTLPTGNEIDREEDLKWYENIWDSIIDLPSNIARAFGWLEDTITNGFNQINNAIKSAVEFVVDGVKEAIKEIFIPDTEDMQNSIDAFINTLTMKFNIDYSHFQSLFDITNPVVDINVDYEIPNVGMFNLKVFDSSYFVEGVTYFRPIIRGFLVLMMFLFHMRQLVGFFGYDAGVVAGRSEHIKSAKEDQKG